MKKYLFSYYLILATIISFGQGQEAVINDDFTNYSFSSNLEIYNSYDVNNIYPVDGNDLNLILRTGAYYNNLKIDFNHSYLTYQPDSLLLSYKFNTENILNTEINISEKNIEVESNQFNSAIYDNEDLNLSSTIFYTLPFTNITESNGYATASLLIKDINTNTTSLMNTFNEGEAYIESNSGSFYAETHIDVTNQYCISRYSDFTDQQDCRNNVEYLFLSNQATLVIDDLKVIAFSDKITGADRTSNNSQKELVNIYNSKGQERNTNTKGELLFYKYSDGSIEKYFN